MIIVRSPLRITLGGGGTDLASYYKAHGGFLISAAIDKYVFVSVTRPFVPGIFLKYSELEHVEKCSDVRHPIIREALELLKFEHPQIEITALADIPSGTGLGSSGSFTTGLLKALHVYLHRHIQADELARMACEIEIDRLKEPIGKQDQYIAAYGGVTCFTFRQDGQVDVAPLQLRHQTLNELEDNLLLFFTGFSRSASDVLRDQVKRTETEDEAMLQNLHFVRELGIRSKNVLEAGKTAEFGALMHDQWENKKRRSNEMSNSKIDEWYELGRRNGAIGGKLVGAGGGGFLMFYAEDRSRLRAAMAKIGLDEVRFQFDFDGTKTLLS
jgi:D-glycero-alpha-D-manno-heptose-7-phosphate kinase